MDTSNQTFSENDLDELFEDSQEKPITDGDLATITSLAEQQVEMELEVLQLENQLKQAKEKLREIATRELPAAMDGVGLTDFTTRDGHKFVVDDFISCGIPKDRKDEAFEYIRTMEGGDIIKSRVEYQFAKGEDEVAYKVMERLREMGYAATLESDVHWQTLKAWCREQLEKGVALDENLLNLYVGRVSKVKLKKEK